MTSISQKTALALVSFVTLVSPTTHAQTSAALAPSDFSFYTERYDAAQKIWVQMNATEQQCFFDRARCECAGDSNNYTGSFKIAIVPSQLAATKIQMLLSANLVNTGGSARLYAGSTGVNCLDTGSAVPGSLSSYCLNLLDPSSWAAEIPGGMAVFETVRVWESPPIPVAWLFNSAQFPVCNSAGACNSANQCGTTAVAQNIYFWAQTSSSSNPDLDNLSFTVNLAGSVPYTPTNVLVEAENQALLVKWSWPAGMDPAADPSILGVQLFCQRGEQDQVYNTGTYGPAFASSAMLCPSVAPVSSAQLAFSDLDPKYLCSGLIPTSATSYQIKALQNGVYYGVGVAAVDKYGNIGPIATTDVMYGSPGLPDAGPEHSAVLAKDSGCALLGWHSERGALWSLLALGALPAGARRRRRRAPG